MVSVNTGYFSECRRLPLPIGLFVWWPFVAGFLLPVFFSFCAMFPRTLFRARWAWTLLLLPGVFLVGLILTLAGSVFLNAAPLSSSSPILGVDHAGSGPADRRQHSPYLVGGLGALVLNYRRSDVNQRRRIRVLVAGTLVAYIWGGARGWVLSVAIVVAGRAVLHVRRLSGIHNAPICCLADLLGLRDSTAPAVRHPSAAASGTPVHAGPACSAGRGTRARPAPPGRCAVRATAAPRYSSRTRLDVSLLGALAALTVVNRQTWLDTLDRRFFRERYDAQRLLRELVEEIREARTFARVAPKVVIRIEAALHPEFVALVSGEPRETTFRTAAIAPPGHVLAPLPVDRKLVAIVRLLGKPLEVTQSELTMAGRTAATRGRGLRRERIHLVVPVTTGADRAEVLLALGLKRSEEPYSRDDLDLLGAIAASLAFLRRGRQGRMRAHGVSKSVRSVAPAMTAARPRVPRKAHPCGRCFCRACSRHAIASSGGLGAAAWGRSTKRPTWNSNVLWR